MPTSSRQAARNFQRALQEQEQSWKQHPGPDTPAMPLPGGSRPTERARASRWERIAHSPDTRAELEPASEPYAVYRRNIENLIGIVRVPVGVAGPLRIRGAAACGEFYVPLATTEAALVASYSRGALAISEAGGCGAVVLAEGVTRTPGFRFHDLQDAGRFIAWMLEEREAVKRAAEQTTRHGQLEEVRFTLEGNHVFLHLDFTTGDASGQNMVTIASEAVCAHIREHCPIRPERMYVEANLSGDKKASVQSFQSVRGKKVVAEVRLPPQILSERLQTTATAMADYWRMSVMGGVLGGTIGVQGHYANGLAALFLATGQDVATISEAAVGVTRLEAEGETLYASVTLPNVIVGTVGGGTGLPSQAAALDLLGLRGTGKARALAEVAASLALAGELSIIAALAEGTFSRAHQRLARGRGPGDGALH